MIDEETLLPPPPKKATLSPALLPQEKGVDQPSAEGELLPPPPPKKKVSDSTGTFSEIPLPSVPAEPYSWEKTLANEPKKPEVILPTAQTFSTAKPEQKNTGSPVAPTPDHKPEMKMIPVDPQKKLPEQQARENPAFDAITNTFLELPEAFSDMGGTTGRDRRIEFYKMAYEKSRAADKTFNAVEFENLVNESEKKWNNANELKQYSDLLAKNPDNLGYQYAVGFHQMELGKTQDAVNNFKAIIEKNPKYSPAYSAMAYLYSDKGMNDQALMFMDDAIENNPNDVALYSNRSVIKERAGDIEGAIKDLDFAKDKTGNKNMQLEIEKRYADIFQRLYQNRDDKAQKYISIIKGDYNPHDAAVDQQFFKERYNEHNRNVIDLTKEVTAENQKNKMAKLEAGDYSDIPQGMTVPEEMRGYIYSKGMSEALDAMISDPKQAGIAGFILNPVGFIARAGVEGISHGAQEAAKGVEEAKPLKVVKGATEAAIAGLMAATPAGWAFTGASAGVQALPYGDVVEKIAFAPVSTFFESDSDAAAIGDLIISGALLHAANKGIGGAKEVLKKAENKEPFTPEDVKVYEESVKAMTEAETKEVLEKAGVSEEVVNQAVNPEVAKQEFVKKHMEDISDAEKVPGIDYERHFSNLYDRKIVEQTSKTTDNAAGTEGTRTEGAGNADSRTDTPAAQDAVEGPTGGGQGILPEGAEGGNTEAGGGKAIAEVSPVAFKDIPDVTFVTDGWEFKKEGKKISETELATGKKTKIVPGEFEDHYQEYLQRESAKPKQAENNLSLTNESGETETPQREGSKGDRKSSGLDKGEKAQTVRAGNRVPKAKREIKNPRAIEALKIEATTPREKVLQYFIGKGQLHPSAIEELYGGAGKSTKGEMRSRIGLLNKEHGLGIDEIAHKLWEQRAEGDERFNTSDYRQAVESVINDHVGTGKMTDELLGRQEPGADFDMYNASIEHEIIDEAADYFDSLTEEQKQELHNSETPPVDFEKKHDEFEATSPESPKALIPNPSPKGEGSVTAEAPVISNHVVRDGDKVTANIGGKKVDGIVTGVAKHKGEIVIDFRDTEGNERFVYGRQLINVETINKIEAPQKPSTRAKLEADLGNATSEMIKAQSEYDKATKALAKDLEEKQSDMFGGTEQKLFEDTAEEKSAIKAEIEARKKILDIAKEKVNKLSSRLGDTLEGQTEIGDQASTKKAYENIVGLTPKDEPGRVPVAPIIGGPVKDISSIIFDVTKETKQRLFYAKPGGRRASLGTYTPGNTAIKIKFTGDLDTTAHELGHSIDDHFGVLSDLQKTPNLPVEQELGKFSPFGSTPPKGHPNPRMYRDAEGFAEFLRALIVNPEKTKAEASNLYELYEAKVHPEYKKAVENFSNDIRSWAGSSGRDMVLSNVQWKPEEKKGIVGQILSKSEPNNMFGITWVDKLAANFVNPFRAFEKANEYAKGLKGIDEVLPENDPILLARVLLGVDGKVSELLESGMIDAEMNVLKDKSGNAKNLKWLIETLDNTDMASIERDAKDVVSYMIAERTVELAKKFDRESVLSGIGGGIFKDADVAKKALDEFNARDPKEVERIKEAADRYRQMADDVLKYMVDKGRLSKENYDKIKADNTQYVAMQRVIETEPGREIEVYKSGGGKLASKTEVIHAIKGSTKKIQNPYTSLLDLIYRGVKESDRNDSLLAFRNLLVPERVNMYDGTPVRLADIGVRAKAGDKETVTIFVDGKPEYWKFQADIYKALKGLDGDAYKLPAVVTALPRVLRWTVTNFPVFAARNVIRDFQDRIIKSNENSYKNLYGIKDLVGDKEHWHEVARAGGLNAGYYMKDKVHYYGLMEQAMKDIAKNKKSILVDPARLSAGWEGYKSLLQKSETVNRVAEYRAGFRKAKEQGMDDYNAKLYAALKSRDLLDFSLMGHYMKVVNQMIPFSNAAIQGMRTAINKAAENPLGFTSRMVAFSVIPSIAIWLLNNSNEEDRKQYNELPDYQRDLFYNFKIGPNNWMSIPKPYELSLMGSAVDRGMSYSAGDKGAFDGYAGTVAKSTLPFDEASFAGGFQSIIEGSTNYDYFRDKNIVPPHEDALAIELRDTERSSRLGKAVQEIAGIDARKADHFINGTFSYYGKTATELSNIGKDGDANPFTLADLGFFKQTPAYNGKSVQEFMKVAKEGNFTSTFPYKEFSRLARAYFKAGTDEEKEKLAKVLNDYAKSTLPLMKKSLEEKIKNKTAE